MIKLSYSLCVVVAVSFLYLVIFFDLTIAFAIVILSFSLPFLQLMIEQKTK